MNSIGASSSSILSFGQELLSSSISIAHDHPIATALAVIATIGAVLCSKIQWSPMASDADVLATPYRRTGARRPTAQGPDLYGLSTENPPLHEAVGHGDFPEVKRLLTQGSEVNQMGALHQTPLHLAAAQNLDVWGNMSRVITEAFNIAEVRPIDFSNQLAILTALIEAGASVNEQDAFGRTPLDLAAAANHALAGHRLIRLGASSNTSDSEISQQIKSWVAESAVAAQFAVLVALAHAPEVRLRGA